MGLELFASKSFCHDVLPVSIFHDINMVGQAIQKVVFRSSEGKSHTVDTFGTRSSTEVVSRTSSRLKQPGRSNSQVILMTPKPWVAQVQISFFSTRLVQYKFQAAANQLHR